MSALVEEPEIRDVPEPCAEEGTRPPLRPARPIGTLNAPTPEDGTELLQGRYLCRGAGALLVGQSGQGKSSLILQMAILWSLGKPCFGFCPPLPLRVLFIQAENDDGDLWEMFHGICLGLQLTDEERRRAGEAILIYNEDARSGLDFCVNVVELLVADHHPDLVIIDPGHAYVGGDPNDAQTVGAFLRAGLNPILHKHNCAVLIIHHTTKQKAEGPQQTHSFLYAGAGSAEWTNWARAVLVLETKGKGCYRLHAPKRGQRIGWRDASGQPVFDKLIRHDRNPDVICWHEAEEEALQTAGKVSKTKTDLLAHVPVEGTMPQSVLLDKANTAGVGGQKKVRAFLDELLADGTLHVHLVKRKGTNPAKLISRSPEPPCE